MAARLRTRHQEEVRTKIQTSQLINRLENHALDGAELSATQIKAIEILLRKNLPDLSQVEITGDPEAPLELKMEVRLVKPGAEG